MNFDTGITNLHIIVFKSMYVLIIFIFLSISG